MTATPSRSTPIVGPLLIVGTAYFVFFAGSYYGIYDVRVRISSLVIVGIILAIYAIAAWRRPSWYPATRLWPALAIGLGVMAIDSAFSRNPRISLDFLAYGVLLAALYVLLRAILIHPDLRIRLGAAMVILAFVIDVAYLAAVANDWLSYWQVLGRFSIPPLRPFFEGLTYGNPGLVAGMAVLLSISASAQLGGGSRSSKTAIVLLWVLTVTVVIVSGTRGAWLALGLMAVVALGAWLAGGRARDRIGLAIGTMPGRVALAGIAVVAVIGLVVFGPTVADRVLLGNDGGRISYWTAAIRMFTDAPVTGVGPGMWAPERIFHTAEGEIDFYIPHAHNVYLQTAADSGLIGIIAGVVVFILVARLVWASLRGGDSTLRRWAVAAVLAAVYFGAHQLFDVFVNTPAAIFAFAFPIAWLDAAGADPHRPAGWPVSSRARSTVLAVGVLAVTLSVGWGLASERSALRLDQAKTALDAGDAATAAAIAADAVSMDPSIPPGQLVLALAAAEAGDMAKVSPALQAVVDADGLPAAWMDLAWLRAGSGDTSGAQDAIAESLRLGQQQAALTLAAGATFERVADTASADHWYATAIAQLPRLAADPYWRDSARANRWAVIEADAADQMSPENRVDLYLSAGEPERANTALAEVADPGVAATLRQVIDAWGGSESARAALEAQANASPRDLALLAWTARLADRAGDHGAAIRYRYLADMQSPGSGADGRELAVVPHVHPPTGLAGVTWPPYGIYTYRRPTPGPLLLDGMPQLVLKDQP